MIWINSLMPHIVTARVIIILDTKKAPADKEREPGGYNKPQPPAYVYDGIVLFDRTGNEKYKEIKRYDNSIISNLQYLLKRLLYSPIASLKYFSFIFPTVISVIFIFAPSVLNKVKKTLLPPKQQKGFLASFD